MRRRPKLIFHLDKQWPIFVQVGPWAEFKKTSLSPSPSNTQRPNIFSGQCYVPIILCRYLLSWQTCTICQKGIHEYLLCHSALTLEFFGVLIFSKFQLLRIRLWSFENGKYLIYRSDVVTYWKLNGPDLSSFQSDSLYSEFRTPLLLCSKQSSLDWKVNVYILSQHYWRATHTVWKCLLCIWINIL